VKVSEGGFDDLGSDTFCVIWKQLIVLTWARFTFALPIVATDGANALC